MKHCIPFKPLDIWLINDDEQFKERKISFGFCPVCQKPVAELIQFSLEKNEYILIKKIGKSANDLVLSLKNQIFFTASKINQLKFKNSTYKWIYGVNKSSKNKIKQYAKDFFGNKVLVKEI